MTQTLAFITVSYPEMKLPVFVEGSGFAVQGSNQCVAREKGNMMVRRGFFDRESDLLRLPGGAPAVEG